MNTSTKLILGLAAAGVGFFLWKNRVKLQQAAAARLEAQNKAKAAAEKAAAEDKQDNEPERKTAYEVILKDIADAYLAGLKKMNDQGYCGQGSQGITACPKDAEGNPIKRTDAVLIQEANSKSLQNFNCMKLDLRKMDQEELTYFSGFIKNVWATGTPPADILEFQKLKDTADKFPIAYSEKPCSPSAAKDRYLGKSFSGEFKNTKIWA